MLKKLGLLLIGALSVFLIGCGVTKSTTSAPVTTRTYVGAKSVGDLVTFTLKPDGTLTLVNSTTGMRVTADYRAATVPQLGIACQEAYNIVVDDTPVSFNAYFKEVPGIALVASIPDGVGGYDLSVYTYGVQPNIYDGSLDGEYHFLDIVTSFKSAGDVQMGSYLVSGPQVSISVNSYATPNGDSPQLHGPCDLSIEGSYIKVDMPSDPTLSVTLTPAGVMIVDKGPGNGMCVGNRVPAQSYRAEEVIGNYLAMTTSGGGAMYVEVLSGTTLNLTIYSEPIGSSWTLEDIAYSEIRPGLYEADLGTHDIAAIEAWNPTMNPHNFGVVKWSMNPQGTFFGIVGETHFTEGCQDNIIGLKVD